MENTPKPTPEFNQLIGESDYLFSKMSKIIYSENLGENVLDPSIDKKKLSIALKITIGAKDMRSKLVGRLINPSQKFIANKYSDEDAVRLINTKFREIVDMRNAIVHSFPAIDNNNEYIKININTNEQTEITKDYINEFIGKCSNFIKILTDEDYVMRRSALDILRLSHYSEIPEGIFTILRGNNFNFLDMSSAIAMPEFSSIAKQFLDNPDIKQITMPIKKIQSELRARSPWYETMSHEEFISRLHKQ